MFPAGAHGTPLPLGPETDRSLISKTRRLSCTQM